MKNHFGNNVVKGYVNYKLWQSKIKSLVSVSESHGFKSNRRHCFRGYGLNSAPCSVNVHYSLKVSCISFQDPYSCYSPTLKEGAWRFCWPCGTIWPSWWQWEWALELESRVLIYHSVIYYCTTGTPTRNCSEVKIDLIIHKTHVA
jgi:hypothetical protein